MGIVWIGFQLFVHEIVFWFPLSCIRDKISEKLKNNEKIEVDYQIKKLWDFKNTARKFCFANISHLIKNYNNVYKYLHLILSFGYLWHQIKAQFRLLTIFRYSASKWKKIKIINGFIVSRFQLTPEIRMLQSATKLMNAF